MPSILIVEKNEFLRRFLREVLEAQFPACSIEDTGDARVALQKTLRGSPDLALVDIRLDGMSGLDLAARMKGVHPEMIVCLMPDADLPEYRDGARRCGADHCFAKDALTSTRLNAFIRSTLRRSARTRRARARRRRFPAGKTTAPSVLVG